MSADWLTLMEAHCREFGQQRTADLIGYSQTTISLALKGKYMADTTKIETAVRERLATTWLGTLRAECERTTQAQCAQRLGVSETTVSQCLSGSYKANTQRIERRVRGELLGSQCLCPVMGEVSERVCQDVQEKQPGKGGAGIGNPQHAQAWHACRGTGRFGRVGACPNFNGAGSKPAKQAEAA